MSEKPLSQAEWDILPQLMCNGVMRKARSVQELVDAAFNGLYLHKQLGEDGMKLLYATMEQTISNLYPGCPNDPSK